MRLFCVVIINIVLALPLVAGFLPHVQQQQRRRQASPTPAFMFTGIIEEMGTVVSLEERDDMVLWDGTTGKGTELTVKGGVVMEGAYLG
jgi:hypothetical protein